MEYNREKAKEYAKKWAYARNPEYYNFDPVGGDCTSFVSQCMYTANETMNYSKTNGWYYKNGYDKSPSWSGVEFLYKFLTQNNGAGPYGKETEYQNLKIGDIIQLSFNGKTFGHSLIVVQEENNLENIKVATHTFDSYGRSVASYSYQKARFIHILGVRN